MENLTQTKHIRHTFTDTESLVISRKMAEAAAAINEKIDELKSVSTSIKADIAVQEGILHSCAEKVRSGYEIRPVECDVKYDEGTAKFTDKATGEVVEERPMTQDEQMRLTEHRIDAEVVIRQAREEEEG